MTLLRKEGLLKCYRTLDDIGSFVAGCNVGRTKSARVENAAREKIDGGRFAMTGEKLPFTNPFQIVQRSLAWICRPGYRSKNSTKGLMDEPVVKG